MTRWQISGFIMLIPYYGMIALGIVNPTINMIIASFVGGLVFYRIDQCIFKGGFKWENVHTVVLSMQESLKNFLGMGESEQDYVSVKTAQDTSK
jgi:hypothetical protein